MQYLYLQSILEGLFRTNERFTSDKVLHDRWSVKIFHSTKPGSDCNDGVVTGSRLPGEIPLPLAGRVLETQAPDLDDGSQGLDHTQKRTNQTFKPGEDVVKQEG